MKAIAFLVGMDSLEQVVKTVVHLTVYRAQMKQVACLVVMDSSVMCVKTIVQQIVYRV